jgi:hypothetical protein
VFLAFDRSVLFLFQFYFPFEHSVFLIRFTWPKKLSLCVCKYSCNLLIVLSAVVRLPVRQIEELFYQVRKFKAMTPAVDVSPASV